LTEAGCLAQVLIGKITSGELSAGMLTRQGFLVRLIAAAAIAIAVAAVVFVVFGRDKFVMFGPVAGALFALPVLSSAMKARARMIRDRAWLRFFSLLPLLLWALVIGGFWALFLSSRDGAIMAAMSRNAANVAAGPVLPVLYWLPFAVLGLHCLSLFLGRDKLPPAQSKTGKTR
jgi:hypothetical protein